MSDATKGKWVTFVLGLILASAGWWFYGQVVLPERCYREMFWDLRRMYAFIPRDENVVEPEFLDEEFGPDPRGRPPLKDGTFPVYLGDEGHTFQVRLPLRLRAGPPGRGPVLEILGPFRQERGRLILLEAPPAPGIPPPSPKK